MKKSSILERALPATTTTPIINHKTPLSFLPPAHSPPNSSLSPSPCPSSPSLTDRLKPHPCTFPNCTLKFARAEHLKRHLRSHTGEKPFPCPFPGCTKAFSRCDNMMQHLKGHNKIGRRKRRSRKTQEQDQGEERQEREEEEQHPQPLQEDPRTLPLKHQQKNSKKMTKLPLVSSASSPPVQPSNHHQNHQSSHHRILSSPSLSSLSSLSSLAMSPSLSSTSSTSSTSATSTSTSTPSSTSSSSQIPDQKHHLHQTQIPSPIIFNQTPNVTITQNHAPFQAFAEPSPAPKPQNASSLFEPLSLAVQQQQQQGRMQILDKKRLDNYFLNQFRIENTLCTFHASSNPFQVQYQELLLRKPALLQSH